MLSEHYSVLVVQAVVTIALLSELVRSAEPAVVLTTKSEVALYLQDAVNHPLESFSELWQGIFLWGFFAVLFIHIVSAIIAFLMLRRHKYGRFWAAGVLVVGTVATFVMSAATSAAVGFVLYQAQITLQPIQVMMCGVAQTTLLILFSFSKLMMPTL